MNITRNILASFLLVVAFGSSAIAQTSMVQRPMDTAFFLELAQTLMARGEYNQARVILDKLNQTEPNNPAVQDLLEKASNQPTTPSKAINPGDIAADIAAIQTKIQRDERRNRDLEFLIRQLVQENDILGQTLAKRNRDLLELMKKVYGEGAQLPEIKITTDVERTRAIMNSYQDQIVQRDREQISRNEELAGMMQQIEELNASLKNYRGRISPVDGASVENVAARVEKSAPPKGKAVVPVAPQVKDKKKTADDQPKREPPQAKAPSAGEETKPAQAKPVEQPAENPAENPSKEIAPQAPVDQGSPKELKKELKKELEKKLEKEPAKQDLVKETTDKKAVPSTVDVEQQDAKPAGKPVQAQTEPKQAATKPSPQKLAADSAPDVKADAKKVASLEPVDIAPVVEKKKAVKKSDRAIIVDEVVVVPEDETPATPKEPSEAKKIAKAAKVAPQEEVTPPEDIDQLTENLQDKRQYLFEKSLAVLEKSRELEGLRMEIARYSSAMQDADNRYDEAMKENDTKIQTIKSSWVKDKNRYQDETYALRDQVLTKTKEITRLQNYIANQAALFDARKQKLAQKDRAIADFDQAIFNKDKEILQLKSLLDQQDRLISHQKTQISDQGALIQFADDKTFDLKKRTVQIRQSLADGDQPLADLRERVLALKKRAEALSQAPVSDPALKTQAAELQTRLDAAVDQLRQKESTIKDLEGRLEARKADGITSPDQQERVRELEKRLQEARERERALTDQLDKSSDGLRRNQQMIDELNAKFEDLKAHDTTTADRKKAEELEGRLKEARINEESARHELETSRQKMQILVENLQSFKENAATASQRASDLSEKMYTLEDRLEKEVHDTAEEMKFLKATLDQRDREALAMKKEAIVLKEQLAAKEDELNYFYRTVSDATKALNEHTLNHDQTPTSPSWASRSEILPVPGEAPWDPKNNDAYALQQRLAISTKELKAVQGELSVKESKLQEMEARLNEREQELTALKGDYERILAADNSKDQARKSRVKGESLNAVALNQKLAQAQDQIKEMKNEMADSKRNAQKLQDDLKAKEKVLKILTSKLEAKNREVADYKADLKEKDEQIELQRQAVDHESKKFESLQKEMGQTSKLVDLGQNKFAAKDLSIQDLQARLNNAQIRERDYKNQVSEMERNLRESYRMVKQDEDRLSDIKLQLENKENRVQLLEKEIERLKKSLSQRSTEPKE